MVEMGRLGILISPEFLCKDKFLFKDSACAATSLSFAKVVLVQKKSIALKLYFLISGGGVNHFQGLIFKLVERV